MPATSGRPPASTSPSGRTRWLNATAFPPTATTHSCGTRRCSSTSVLVLHHLARYLGSTPGLNFDTVELAASFGLANSHRTATSEGFNRTMHRLVMFGMTRTIGTTVHVRTILPPLRPRQLRLLPNYLRATCPWATSR